MSVLAALLGVVLATVAVIIAGPWSLAYIAIYVLATMPGWPLGRALFGSHPAGWIAGALAGYGLTSLALWVVIALGLPSGPMFALAWAIVVVLSWGTLRKRGPLVALPALDRRDARTLLLLLLLVPAVFVFPYKNLGARDAGGNRFYRAYFTADFFLHTALTAELTKYDMPPHTPYAGDRSLQDYWTYFLLPAVVAEEGPAGLADVETCLEANAFCSAILFLSMLILTTWSASGSAPATALAVLVAVLAASAEGVYTIRHLMERGRPLSDLTDWNIDAVTAWEFGGLRIDSLVRSMWYNPQHSLSAALGLVSWLVAGTVGARASMGAIALTGTMLGLSTVFNPLVGGLFSLIYGIVIAVDVVRTQEFVLLARHAVAALLVGLAVAYCVGNRMVEGAGGAVLFGLGGFARNRPIATLLLSLGPLLVPAALGLWPPWRLPLRVWPAAGAAVVGLALPVLRSPVDGGVVHRIPRGASSAVGAARLCGDVLRSPLAERLAGRGRRRCACAHRRGVAHDSHRRLQRAGHSQQADEPRRLSLDGHADARRTAGVPVDQDADSKRRHRPDGPGGARPRNLEPDPHVCLAAHGGFTVHRPSADERRRVRAALEARARDLR